MAALAAYSHYKRMVQSSRLSAHVRMVDPPREVDWLNAHSMWMQPMRVECELNVHWMYSVATLLARSLPHYFNLLSSLLSRDSTLDNRV